VKIEARIPLLESIFDERKTEIGNDFPGYKNHVYRMINFCLALADFQPEEREKIIVAGCFHDIGSWTGVTFDYLPPSTVSATEYLTRHKLEKWIPDVKLMIDMHHQLGKDGNNRLADVFRRGDSVDFSLGFIKFGLPKDYVTSVKKQFPNAGFRKRLVKLAGAWICRHPLNPIPVLKW
jgi:hypothetical protein